MSLALETQNSIIDALNKELYFRGITKVDLSKKLGLKTSSNLINILNGKRKTSDDFLVRIAKAIWLSQKEIDDIYAKAEKSTYKKIFWKSDFKKYTSNDLIELIAEKEWLSRKQVNKLKDFIKYLK